MGFGTTSVRWSQLGFGRTSSTSTSQATPRNLFGFKDGTRNLKAEDTDLLRDHVWAQPGDGPAWLDGGSYLVARRIRMHIEVWDRTSLNEQESIIGRNKGEGAPLGPPHEFDTPNLAAPGAIAPDAHIRLASEQNQNGVRILRRGYNFVDGSDGQGHLNAGLFFLAFMRNPQTHFVPMQRALAGKDRLMEYIEHTGSAVFAIPAGLGDGYWGQTCWRRETRATSPEPRPAPSDRPVGPPGLSSSAWGSARQRRPPPRRRAPTRRTAAPPPAARPRDPRPRASPRRPARTAAPPPRSRTAAAPPAGPRGRCGW